MRTLINFTGDSLTWRGMRFGGGPSPPSTTTSQVKYSPEEEAARNAVFKEGERLYNQTLPQATTYQGPRPVGTDPATELAQNMGLQTGMAAQGSTVPSAINATNFQLNNAADVRSNPYLQGAIQAAVDPQVRNFTNSVLPALRMNGMMSGSFGSDAQALGEGQAVDALQRNISNTAASMANTGYQTGLEAQSSTLRNLPSIMQGIQAPTSMISGVGAQRENIASENEAYQALQREQAITGPWQLLQARAGLLSSIANPVTQTTTSGGSRQGISPMQGIGAGLGAAAMMAGKMSDRRLKKDIVWLGNIEGVNVYLFRYTKRGPSGRWIGTMADEVPHAASLAADGYMRVNYAALPVPFAQVEA